MLGSFSSSVGGISQSRHLTLGAISRARLFKQNGSKAENYVVDTLRVPSRREQVPDRARS